MKRLLAIASIAAVTTLMSASPSRADWSDPYLCLAAVQGGVIEAGANPLAQPQRFDVVDRLHLPTEEGAPEELRLRGIYRFFGDRQITGYCSLYNNVDGSSSVEAFLPSGDRWVSFAYSPNQGWRVSMTDLFPGFFGF